MTKALTREEMVLLTVALDDTGGCLRYRTVMRDQPEAAVRREYGLAAVALTEDAGGAVWEMLLSE